MHMITRSIVNTRTHTGRKYTHTLTENKQTRTHIHMYIHTLLANKKDAGFEL